MKFNLEFHKLLFPKESLHDHYGTEEQQKISLNSSFLFLQKLVKSANDVTTKTKIFGSLFDPETGVHTIFNGLGEELLSVSYAKDGTFASRAAQNASLGTTTKPGATSNELLPVAWRTKFTSGRHQKRILDAKAETAECKLAYDA